MQLSFLSTGVSALLIMSANASKEYRADPPCDMWLAYSINWEHFQPGQVMITRDGFEFCQLVKPGKTEALVTNPDDKATDVVELPATPIGSNLPENLFVFDGPPDMEFDDAVSEACIGMFRKSAADWFPQDRVVKIIKDRNDSHPDFVVRLSDRINLSIGLAQSVDKQDHRKLDRLHRAARVVDKLRSEWEKEEREKIRQAKLVRIAKLEASRQRCFKMYLKGCADDDSRFPLKAMYHNEPCYVRNVENVGGILKVSISKGRLQKVQNAGFHLMENITAHPEWQPENGAIRNTDSGSCLAGETPM